MKKKTVSPKKRTARRRKRQRSKKRQRSLQQRLARLAKAQQPFNSLAAALAKASASTISLVESEKLQRLPLLGKSPLNISIDSQNSPHGFGLNSPVLQRPLSLQGSLSLQRLTSTPQVESSVLCRETALLWVVPRHSWPLSPVGRRPSPPECQPCLLTHVGEPILSAASSSGLLAPALLTDSSSIAVEPRAEKCFQEELPLPDFAPGVPVARRTAAYQQTPAAAEPKAASSDTGADKPPGTEQSPSDDEAEWVDCEVILQNLDTVYKSHQTVQPLRKADIFIKKSYRCNKKPSSQNFRRSTKNQRHCLDKTGFSIARARARLLAASSLCVNPVKLSYRKLRGCYRWCIIKSTNWPYWLIKINVRRHINFSRVVSITKQRPLRNHSDDLFLTETKTETESVLNEDTTMLQVINRIVVDCSQTIAVDAATGAQNIMSEEAPVGRAIQLVRGPGFSLSPPLTNPLPRG